MVAIRYPGVVEARQAFDALRPYRRELIRLQSRCRPFGPDYLILSAAAKALDTAAYHFTGEPDFFADRAHSS
ncbi:MAG: hypothetical protein ABI655_14485 [Phenylobacterium sp.]